MNTIGKEYHFKYHYRLRDLNTQGTLHFTSIQFSYFRMWGSSEWKIARCCPSKGTSSCPRMCLYSIWYIAGVLDSFYHSAGSQLRSSMRFFWCRVKLWLWCAGSNMGIHFWLQGKCTLFRTISSMLIYSAILIIPNDKLSHGPWLESKKYYQDPTHGI